VKLCLTNMGLATAFGPTLAATQSANQTAAYFRNAQFMNAAFAPHVCAFRQRDGLGVFEDRIAALLDEAVHDLLSRQHVALDVNVVLHLAEPAEGLPRARLTAPHLVDGVEPDYVSPAVGDVGAAFLAVALATLGEWPTLMLAGAAQSRDRGAVMVAM
jgi:hypothetical protein